MAAGAKMTRVELARWMAEQVAVELGLPVDKVDEKVALTRYGLDSLQVVTLVSSLEDLLGRKLDLAVFWEHPSIEALTTHLLEHKGEGPASAKAVIVEDATAGIQQAIYDLQQHFPGTYLTSRAYTLQGVLEPALLQTALDEMMARHGLLRSTFHRGPADLKVKEHAGVTLKMELVDAARMSDAELGAQLTELSTRGFDPTKAPLARAALFRRSPQEHVFLLCFSHLIIDAWSYLLMMNELGGAYAALEKKQPSTIPASSFRYAQFVADEVGRMASEESSLRTFWKGQLEGRVPFVPLPTARPRGADDELLVVGKTLQLDGAFTQRLRELAEAHEATSYHVMLAGLSRTYASYTGQEQMAITTSVDARRPEHRLTAGPFINHVVFPLDASGNPSVAEYLRRVKATCTTNLTQSYPFDRVLAQPWANWRDKVHVPLLQIQCNYYNFSAGAHQASALREGRGLILPSGSFSFGSLRGAPAFIPKRKAPFDISVWITVVGDELQCRFEYRECRFEAAWMDELLGRYRAVLDAMAANPSQRLADIRVGGR